jgi:hypothetical protein
VIAAGLLRKAVTLGRVTVEDAADLASVFVHVASRQARDTLTAARRRVQRPRRPT